MKTSEPKFSDVLSIESTKPLLEEARRISKELLTCKHELKEDMPVEELKEQLLLVEKLAMKTGVAGQTLDVLFSVETDNERYRQAMANEEREATAIREELLYFGLMMKEWPVARLQFYAEKLPEYKEYFLDIARHAKHALSEKEERIILLKNKVGGSVHDRVYTIITSRFTYEIEVDGKKLTLTDGELRAYSLHERRELRKAAMEALLVPFSEHADELGEIYFAMSEDYDVETVQLRGYASPIESRHLGNTIPAAAYNAMAASAQKNKHIFQRFIKIKQQILGLPDFERWDFNAPVPGMPPGMSYDESRKFVIGVFENFAPWLSEAAKSVFEAGRVDALPRKGKRGGAFCAPMVPGELPLVMLNHNDTFDAVSTMAHELGHAVHQIVSKEHSILVWNAPIVLAETASVFCEQLLVQTVLKKADSRTKKALLCHLVDEAMRSISSQLRYTRFEEQAHEMIREGCAASDLDALWSKLQRQDFPTVSYPEKSVAWRAIPHLYHYPFYCYGYAFGQLLVLALWKRYEEEGESFVPKLHALLAAGGSEEPAVLLAKLGFDISDQAFWDGGFATIESWVDELERTA